MGIAMRVEYINPFIISLKNAFQTMLNCEARRGEVVLKSDNHAKHEISGIIGLSGKAVGTVVLSFSRSVALKAASVMLMADAPDINSDVFDAVGELTNIVAGGAKAQLERFQMMVSLPHVVTGTDYELHFPSDVKPISIHFETDWGPLTLEVGLIPVEEVTHNSATVLP